jgi:hypothetical protein
MVCLENVSEVFFADAFFLMSARVSDNQPTRNGSLHVKCRI